MSTNIDHFSPDENWLQGLANDLFKKDFSYATGTPAQSQVSPLTDNPTDPRFLSDFVSHPSSLPGVAVASPGISPSFGGAGLSPGIFNPTQEINLGSGSDFNKQGQYSNENSAPGAVAGSGISPSAHEQNNGVNLEDPQTALADPHFPEEGKVPTSVAGSGASPSVKYLDQKDLGKGPSKDSFFPDIEKILSSIIRQESGPQLHYAPEQFSTHSPSYYFIDETKSPDASTYRKSSFNAEFIKKDFPILGEYVNGKPLIWLDNAATTQKPKSVIDRISYFYEHENSNVHRAAHELAARSTDAYEGAREKVRRFLN
ncbi:MAG TPA: aminotransferase class V-fold PLP-dependent enzyme, partial [Puia sp.]|nr:aminotransferase class V-fold PLP-dependent enzyme [Puia sp.]